MKFTYWEGDKDMNIPHTAERWSVEHDDFYGQYEVVRDSDGGVISDKWDANPGTRDEEAIYSILEDYISLREEKRGDVEFVGTPNNLEIYFYPYRSKDKILISRRKKKATGWDMGSKYKEEDTEKMKRVMDKVTALQHNHEQVWDKQRGGRG